MTPERIAKIRAACEAATPGPWEADLSPGSDPDEGYPNHGWAWPAKLYSDGGGDYMLWGDVQFCVVARTAVPELLAEVERLEGILVAVRAEMERLRAGATRECGMLDLGHTEPANVCDACYVQVVHMLGETEAENARLRAALEDFAEHDCAYGDNCPTFGTRHGTCIGCQARAALHAEERADEPLLREVPA